MNSFQIYVNQKTSFSDGIILNTFQLHQYSFTILLYLASLYKFQNYLHFVTLFSRLPKYSAARN